LAELLPEKSWHATSSVFHLNSTTTGELVHCIHESGQGRQQP